MLPPRCITCSKFLADIELEWQEYKKGLDNDEAISDEAKADLLSKKLNKLKVFEPCCRTLLLSYILQSKIIIP